MAFIPNAKETASKKVKARIEKHFTYNKKLFYILNILLNHK